jgi:Tfp pilus assembly protein PilF
MYMDALDVMEATLGPDHVEIPDVLNSLGLVSKKLAQYEKAMRCYSRALDVRTSRVHGGN